MTGSETAPENATLYHFIMMITWNDHRSEHRVTRDGLIGVRPGDLMQDLYHEIMTETRESAGVPEDTPVMTMFFDIRPNTMNGGL